MFACGYILSCEEEDRKEDEEASLSNPTALQLPLSTSASLPEIITTRNGWFCFPVGNYKLPTTAACYSVITTTKHMYNLEQIEA